MPDRWDVVVLGGGSAGAAAAAATAGRGLKTLLLERGDLSTAGARWCNAVPGWCFDEGGVARPTAPEARGGPAVHLIAGWGPERLYLSGQDVMEVDMRLLIGRLQGLAADRGAVLRGGVRAQGVVGDQVHTSEGTVRARWIVDATGLHGQPHQPRVPREDLCTAVQGVFELADPAAARAWFEAQGAQPGEIVCFTGVAGGYSIVNVRLHGDREAAILTGSIPALGTPSARVLLDRFVADNPWMGTWRFGGARAIPVGGPHPRLHEGRVAYVGDAASQVYAAHGSGVGLQLVAARLLADTLADGGTPGDYARAWWRDHGGEVAASAVFQRFSRTLDGDFLGRMMTAGLMVPELTRATLEQRTPRITAGVLARIARGASRDPAAVARVLPVLARMGLARAGRF